MKKFVLFIAYAIIFTSLSSMFISCGGGKEDNQNKEQPATDSTLMVEPQQNFVLPSPVQISFIFKKSGLVFIPNVTIPLNYAEKYNTNVSKSLMFGAYSSDVSYLVFNGKRQEALEHMKIVKKLSDDLGMVSVVDENTLKQFEKNINNEDSLVDLLVKIQEKMDKYLQENNSKHKQIVYFTGGWLEGMYVGSRDLKKSTSELSKRLVEQMSILENLLEGFKIYPEKTDEINKVVEDLTALKAIYDNFEEIKKYNKDDIIPFDEIVISKVELSNMQKKIEEIRNNLIGKK